MTTAACFAVYLRKLVLNMRLPRLFAAVQMFEVRLVSDCKQLAVSMLLGLLQKMMTMRKTRLAFDKPSADRKLTAVVTTSYCCLSSVAIVAAEEQVPVATLEERCCPVVAIVAAVLRVPVATTTVCHRRTAAAG
jgi:hypothetical protein